MGRLVICDHPLIQHKLTFIRDKATNSKEFRELVDEVATLMGIEVTRDIPLTTTTVETPVAVTESELIVIDPMLATGGSANAAIQMLKERGCRPTKLMSLIAAPEGVRAVQEAHPDIDIFTAAVDERLDDHGYIVPGLGDAGDRLFGTK